MAFLVITNHPGYLPDDITDLEPVATLDDARAWLEAELLSTADARQPHGATKGQAAWMATEAAAANVDESIVFAGWAHTIVREA